MSPLTPASSLDDVAESYGYARATRNVANRMRTALVLRHLETSYSVLDIGCANGLYLLPLSPHCAHITGIDISPKLTNIARASIAKHGIGNATVVTGDAHHLPLESAAYDLVYCFATLPILADDAQALREIRRVLKPRGLAILDITGKRNLGYRYFRRWWISRNVELHAYSYRSILKTLANCGFRLVESCAFGFTDQWKSIPLLRQATWLERLFHGGASELSDADSRISNLAPFFHFASRWYLVCRRD